MKRRYGRSNQTLDLFDQGCQRRDRGADRVMHNTPDDWAIACDRAIAKLAATCKEFTAEDVRAICGDPPNHPNAMGARFLSAVRGGALLKVGYRHPARKSSHASVIAVWRGKTLTEAL